MKMFNIDGVNIPFDPTWNSIAISVSGGADSALLAYILNSIAPTNIDFHIISHTRMWKTRPWQGYDSKQVYEYLLNCCPTRSVILHKGFIAPELEYGNIGPILIDEYGKKVSGDNIQQRAFAEYVCYQNKIDAYYNAVTRNPRNANFQGMKERDIERTENNKHLEIMQHMDAWALHPFRFVEKSWIIKQYKRLGIMDLFEKTRSCEGEFLDINYTNYKEGQYVPTCGTCFWCKEREWAIEQNK